MKAAAVEVELAYRECERTTRREAANFYYGIRLLPVVKRQAMSAVYAFARRVDDVGDDEGIEPAVRLAELAAERALIDALARGEEAPLADPVAVALAHADATFELPLDALTLLVDGVEMDVTGRTYETIDELVVYCRAVAGSIGRLCLAIFTGRGRPAPGAERLADDLGVAMQLTNVLRDVREDAARGRTYLPAEDLAAFGCPDPLHAPPDRVAALVAFEAQRAHDWFERGMGLVDLLEPRSASCLLAMTGIYRQLLHRIERYPLSILRERLSLSPWEKAWVAGRSLAGAQRPLPAGGAR
jgi:phytoene synthase